MAKKKPPTPQFIASVIPQGEEVVIEAIKAKMVESALSKEDPLLDRPKVRKWLHRGLINGDPIPQQLMAMGWKPDLLTMLSPGGITLKTITPRTEEIVLKLVADLLNTPTPVDQLKHAIDHKNITAWLHNTITQQPDLACKLFQLGWTPNPSYLHKSNQLKLESTNDSFTLVLRP
jgi:hypothetical protein